MILKMFTIYDVKAKAYLPPFFLQEDGMATRAFADCANDPNHAFGRNPADYTLFNIGSFADNTAQFETNKTPITLGVAIEFVNPNVDKTELELVNS